MLDDFQNVSIGESERVLVIFFDVGPITILPALRWRCIHPPKPTKQCLQAQKD